MDKLEERIEKLEARINSLEQKFDAFRAEVDAKFDILFEGQKQLLTDNKDFSRK